MKYAIGSENASAEDLLPPKAPDGSKIGVNYVDAWLQGISGEWPDGGKVTAKRKGLEVTLQVGDAKGAGLLRRLENGPDERQILRRALEEAAASAGFVFSAEGGTLFLEEVES